MLDVIFHFIGIIFCLSCFCLGLFFIFNSWGLDAALGVLLVTIAATTRLVFYIDYSVRNHRHEE